MSEKVSFSLSTLEVTLLHMLILHSGDASHEIAEQYTTPELEAIVDDDEVMEKALTDLFTKLGIKREHMFPEYTPTFEDDEEDED